MCRRLNPRGPHTTLADRRRVRTGGRRLPQGRRRGLRARKCSRVHLGRCFPAPWSWSRPRSPIHRVPAQGKWEHILLDQGYRFVMFDGLNRFYAADGEDEPLPLARERAGRLRAPPGRAGGPACRAMSLPEAAITTERLDLSRLRVELARVRLTSSSWTHGRTKHRRSLRHGAPCPGPWVRATSDRVRALVILSRRRCAAQVRAALRHGQQHSGCRRTWTHSRPPTSSVPPGAFVRCTAGRGGGPDWISEERAALHGLPRGRCRRRGTPSAPGRVVVQMSATDLSGSGRRRSPAPTASVLPWRRSHGRRRAGPLVNAYLKRPRSRRPHGCDSAPEHPPATPTGAGPVPGSPTSPTQLASPSVLADLGLDDVTVTAAALPPRTRWRTPPPTARGHRARDYGPDVATSIKASPSSNSLQFDSKEARGGSATLRKCPWPRTSGSCSYKLADRLQQLRTDHVVDRVAIADGIAQEEPFDIYAPARAPPRHRRHEVAAGGHIVHGAAPKALR